MKKSLLLLFPLLLPFFSAAQNYASQNVTLLGHWQNPNEPAEPQYGVKYQGVWGWKDTTNNHEYAIIGSSTGCYFIDVTNPANPVQCDSVTSVHTGGCIWHEIKTFQHYCYLISDDPTPNSFMIIDLQYLPDSVHVLYNDTTVFERCHTLYIEGDKMYGASITRKNNVYYSMAVYDLWPDPVHPTLLRALNQDYPTTPAYTHDMLVTHDTVFCSAGYEGFFIYNYDSVANHFTQLAALTQYPDRGYNHSSAITADRHTLIFTDEVPAGMGMKSLDVSDFGNLTVLDVFRSNTGDTPHNPYIIGNSTLVAANYCDGVQIFNISNPSNCVRTGYFDTDTLINFPNYTQDYHGCWGAYTDLPSGNILASDMQNGLYIFDISQAVLASIPQNHSQISLDAWPNPFNAGFSVNLQLDRAQQVHYAVFDNAGRMVLNDKMQMPSGTSLLNVPAENLSPGMYTVKIEGESFVGTARLVKVK